MKNKKAFAGRTEMPFCKKANKNIFKIKFNCGIIEENYSKL